MSALAARQPWYAAVMMSGARLSIVLASLVPIACGDNAGNNIVPVPDAAPPDAPPVVDAMPPPDARIANLDCNSDEIATTADDPVNLAGAAFSVSAGGGSPVEGAAVEIRSFADPDGAALASTTSDANGDYAVQLDTGAAPLDVFVRVTADTLLPTELFPPTVISTDAMSPTAMFEIGTISLLSQLTGQSQDFDNNGFAVVLVIDCDQTPIEGAVVTPPSGSVVYAGANGFPDTSLEKTSTAGLALVFDVEPGADLVFDAEAMGMSLRDNHARIAAGTVATLAIAPGVAP